MRILLVEDDRQLGKATEAGLRTVYAVDWCRDAASAEGAIATTAYDLIVLDIGLPDRSGLDLLKSLRARDDRRPVLFLTARDAVEHRVEGLNAGADDYLVKPFDLDELLARVAALLRRRHGRALSLIRHGDLVIDEDGRSVHRDGEPVPLSAREFAILEILINNRGRIVSRNQIESQVYDWSSEEIESNTIEVHISALRRKLGRDLIRTVRGLGYTIPEWNDAPTR